MFFWQLDIAPNHETTGVDAAEFRAAVAALSDGIKLPLLIYRGPGSTPSLNSLKVFAIVAPKLLSGVAYWATSAEAATTSKLVREVFLPSLPVEVFTNADDAVRWIEAHVADPAAARRLGQRFAQRQPS